MNQVKSEILVSKLLPDRLLCGSQLPRLFVFPKVLKPTAPLRPAAQLITLQFSGWRRSLNLSASSWQGIVWKTNFDSTSCQKTMTYLREQWSQSLFREHPCDTDHRYSPPKSNHDDIRNEKSRGKTLRIDSQMYIALRWKLLHKTNALSIMLSLWPPLPDVGLIKVEHPASQSNN